MIKKIQKHFTLKKCHFCGVKQHKNAWKRVEVGDREDLIEPLTCAPCAAHLKDIMKTE